MLDDKFFDVWAQDADSGSWLRWAFSLPWGEANIAAGEAFISGAVRVRMDMVEE